MKHYGKSLVALKIAKVCIFLAQLKMELKCKTCKKNVDEQLYIENEGFCKSCKVIVDDNRLRQKKTLINFEDYRSKDNYGKARIKKN